MRKKDKIKFSAGLAALGLSLVMAGCSKGGQAQESSAETAQAAGNSDAQAEWEEEDKQTLRYVFDRDFGGRAGVCVPMAALGDEERMGIVESQFNSVTMENEMKPESLLGSSPNIGEDGFPVLDFTVSDTILKEIKAYNDTVGMDEKKISVRGHVLVWHSQTPEWFFHEDYDESKPYVSKDVMLARMENYIRQVMEHYDGADSEFKGMIYAWDVVNEAVNDTDGGMRTDSSWFKVFYSFDYVEQAFVYANKYAPKDVKLFYNDYNDTNAKKADGICALIQQIQANPEARIDGMGMQGHYDMNFSASEFEESAKKYAALVDEIQITELDMKSSTDYDGIATEEEYQKQAYVYKSLYDTVIRLKNEENIPITAIVFWGTDDGNSWLQDANSVGGSADGTRAQCPLLYDADYEKKPAFWAFVDATQLKPVIQKLQVLHMDDYEGVTETVYGDENTKVKFQPIWNENGLGIRVQVKDDQADDEDSVTVYAGIKTSDKGMEDIQVITVSRAEGISGDKGYETTVFFDREKLEAFEEIEFDIRVNDGGKLLSWNDTNNNQDNSREAYGRLVLKPFATIYEGTVTVDGVEESEWEKAPELELTVVSAEGGQPEASAKAKALWDEHALYVLIKVADPNLDVSGAEVHTRDSVEVFVDEKNDKADGYKTDDKQYRVNCENDHSFNGSACKEDYIISETVKTEEGYMVELAIEWSEIQAQPEMLIGFEVQVNDCKAGERLGMLNWYDTTNTCWSSPASYGTARLAEDE